MMKNSQSICLVFCCLLVSLLCCKPDAAPPYCNDGMMNGTETDIDCGGVCPECVYPNHCFNGLIDQDSLETNIDCGGPCPGCEVPASCSDSVQNGTETGVDCGGDCSACPVLHCNNGLMDGDETDVDCGGSCSACPPAHCNNGVLDGDESEVDCGGSCADCPTCTDGIQNGTETGIDCGGACAPCAAQPNCNDGVMNGSETGIDCGGPDCPACISVSFTCDIDGSSWSGWTSGFNISEYNSGSKQISGYRDGTQSDQITMHFGDEALEETTYPLIAGPFNPSGISGEVTFSHYGSITYHAIPGTGHLTLTTVDTTQNYIEGTFSVDAKDDNNTDTIEVRNGSFTLPIN